MPFVKGRSGNPAGRPPGAGHAAKIRAALAQRSDELLEVVIGAALAGDMTAARLVLDRIAPALKPTEAAEPVPLNGNTLTERAASVLDAVQAGHVSMSQAAQLLAALGHVARLAEIDDLEARVRALEGNKDHEC